MHLQVHPLVGGQPDVAQRGACALRQHLHRDDHAVVLCHRHDDLRQHGATVVSHHSTYDWPASCEALAGCTKIFTCISSCISSCRRVQQWTHASTQCRKSCLSDHCRFRVTHAWLTSSPGFRLAVPHACATRFTASLALRVNTISLQLSAFTKDATYKTVIMLTRSAHITCCQPLYI